MAEPLRARRIAVTGGAGFLGRAVLRALAQRGCAAPFVPRRRDYDLRTAEGIARFLDDARPQLVIHLAAVVGGIEANRRRPADFLYDNLVMGLQLIGECRRAGVQKFVCVGTTCSYPQHTPLPVVEDSLWDGYPEPTNAPYGLAKRMLVTQLQAEREQYGLNGISLLPANLYGPGDNFDLETAHVIPALIRKCVEGRRGGADSVTCWGSGRPTREFLYVDDCAEGILLAAERYDEAAPVNLAAGGETRIDELAQEIARLTGFTGRLEWDRSRPDGQPRRWLDGSRAAAFGFRAATPLEQGLRRTIEWYERRAGTDAASG